jgi:hypothetical protein
MLGISLNTVGISQARGVELIAQREQLDATRAVAPERQRIERVCSLADAGGTLNVLA